jgi:membrane-associated phospholipid phosphatase
MKSLYLDNKAFLIPWFIMIFIISGILFRYDKIDIQIFINSNNSHLSDFFFKYWTWLGDGITVTLIALSLLFIKYRYALITGTSLIITGLTIQAAKHLFFSGSYRPLLYFKIHYQGAYNLHTVAGAEPASFFSFPSGHTAAAFALFFSLSIFVKKKFLKFLFLIAAVLVGYSRIYLSWHFLSDALAGSVAGVLITAVSYLIINKYKNSFLKGSLLKKQ